MNDQMEQKPTNKNQVETPKEIFVINDDLGLGLFLDRLDHFALNRLQVAINPSFMLETLFAEVRQRDYFMKLEYDPNTMSHRIATIMPQMTDLADTVQKEADYSDPFGQMPSRSPKEVFEYPEK